jgi:hypothetical protein
MTLLAGQHLFQGENLLLSLAQLCFPLLSLGLLLFRREALQHIFIDHKQWTISTYRGRDFKKGLTYFTQKGRK